MDYAKCPFFDSHYLAYNYAIIEIMLNFNIYLTQYPHLPPLAKKGPYR